MADISNKGLLAVIVAGMAAVGGGIAGLVHSMQPTPEAAAHRRIEGKTDGCLWACGDLNHLCRCACVCQGRADCLDAGLELNCVFDGFEQNRSEPGCDC